MVFQKYTLWPHMRVYDNVAFGLKLRRQPAAEIKRKVYEALEMVGLRLDVPGKAVSGINSRAASSSASPWRRALVLEPAVLLLDEPLSNLDARLRHAHCGE